MPGARDFWLKITSFFPSQNPCAKWNFDLECLLASSYELVITGMLCLQSAFASVILLDPETEIILGNKSYPLFASFKYLRVSNI